MDQKRLRTEEPITFGHGSHSNTNATMLDSQIELDQNQKNELEAGDAGQARLGL